MNPILSTGLLIGVLCGVWTFVVGFTGWYKDPILMYVFFFVIVIEIGGLVWGLRKTAAQGRNYRAQILAGTMMATLTNGSARSGYIPDDASFGKYTFEVVSSRLQPGCAESAIVNGILDLIADARKSD